MSRNVRAILITGDQPDAPGTPTPGAEDALDVIEGDLEARFQDAEVEIVRLGGSPTNRDVASALAGMTQIVSRVELLVVMFAGHGKEADDWPLAQAWYLSERERFTDIELASALLRFPDGVDTVVISACCYGEGFFRAGEQVPPGRTALSFGEGGSHTLRSPMLSQQMQARKLQSQSKILGSRIALGWDNAHKDSPMVCISAAGKDDAVNLAELMRLSGETTAAARDQRSYAELDCVFADIAAAGRRFHVDTRPPARVNDRVLST